LTFLAGYIIIDLSPWRRPPAIAEPGPRERKIMSLHILKVKPDTAGECQTCSARPPAIEATFELSYWRSGSFRTNVRVCSDCLGELKVAIDRALIEHNAGLAPAENPGAPPIANWGTLTKRAGDPALIQAKTRAAARPPSPAGAGKEFLQAIAQGGVPDNWPECGHPVIATPAKTGPNIELECSACARETIIIKSGEGA
jgi:hypothetical protein